MRPLWIVAVLFGIACNAVPTPSGHAVFDAAIADGSSPHPATAQERALAERADWGRLPVFGSGRYREQSSADLGDRVAPIPLLENANIDTNNFICRSVDAQLADQAVLAFEFAQASCDDADVHGVELARFEGSGHLDRFWFTENSKSETQPSEQELLRVYVDDEPGPRFEVPLAKALDGSAGELFAPPFGAGMTDRLAWYYPLAFEKRLVIALDQLQPLSVYFHQVGVVMDAARSGSPVETEPAAAADAFAAAKRTLTELPSMTRGALELIPMTLITIPAQGRMSVADLSGPATLEVFHVRFAPADRAALAQLRLLVSWEDESQAAIALPLLDLFAATLDAPVGASAALSGSSSNEAVDVSLGLPMPFSERTQIMLVNEGDDDLSIELDARGERSVPSARFGHLRVQRNQTLAPAAMSVHTLLSASGRGRYVGACAMLEGHGLGDGSFGDEPLNFLEGDVRASIDGEVALNGTGTEDYFDSAFYFATSPIATPFAQSWGVMSDGDRGRASACRFHILGGELDFMSTIAVELEIGPGRPDLLDRYVSVAYFYQ